LGSGHLEALGHDEWLHGNALLLSCNVLFVHCGGDRGSGDAWCEKQGTEGLWG
jgi:hypothetical protein